MKKAFLSLLILFSLVPTFSFAAGAAADDVKLDYSGFVKCDGVVVSKGTEPERQNQCNFVQLINTAKAIINWAFMISIPVIVGLIAYAGFLHMTGVEKNIGKARTVLWNAVIGFVIMLCAWFIVTTALKWLLEDEFQKVAGTLVETQK